MPREGGTIEADTESLGTTKLNRSRRTETTEGTSCTAALRRVGWRAHPQEGCVFRKPWPSLHLVVRQLIQISAFNPNTTVCSAVNYRRSSHRLQQRRVSLQPCCVRCLDTRFQYTWHSLSILGTVSESANRLSTMSRLFAVDLRNSCLVQHSTHRHTAQHTTTVQYSTSRQFTVGTVV